MNLNEFFNDLALNNSRNFKIEQLKLNSSDETLKEVIRLALDPFTNFYIKKIPEYKTSGYNKTLNESLEMLTQLSNRVYTGNAGIQFLTDILSNSREDDAKVIERIINKDLRCGVSTSTANAVWKDLIDEFPYMRCALPKAVKLNEWNWKDGIYSQLKADGSYANLIYSGGQVSIMTREGTVYPLENFQKIIDDVVANFNPETATHGELLIRRDGEILPREIGNGILNSIAKNGSSFEATDIIEFLVWDQIPLEYSVSGGKYNVAYESRFETLKNQVNNCKSISLIETKIVYSLEEAYDHYSDLVSNGFEGSIIKTKTGIWKDTTSKDQVKLKVDCDIDLKIKSFNPGNGKNANTFGSICCVSSDELFEVNVSGFKDKERQEISDNRDNYIGTIMTVRINNIMNPTKNNDKYCAFLPRAVEFRTDKTEADSLARIQEQFDSVIKGK